MKNYMMIILILILTQMIDLQYKNGCGCVKDDDGDPCKCGNDNNY